MSTEAVDSYLRDTARVLVIDDEAQTLSFLERALSDHGFDVVTAATGADGLGHFTPEAFDAVLLDLRMPEMDGFEVLDQIKARDPEAVVIIMTGYGAIESAVQAMKAGATDYLLKPMVPDHLEMVLSRALQARLRTREFHLLKEQVERQSSFEGLIGISPPMRRVYELIRRLAPSDATVLIQGATGTGKELVARAVHHLSPRRDQGYMALNCGALSEHILESELFGHEKGAFTGAFSRKYGLIEQAEDGTLFLDDIHGMGPAVQVKLLRAIQEREVLRVGGTQATAVDFRLIAATNVDLREQMEAGLIRPDLFYRLNVAVINLPPLRERTGDIPLLAQHFATAQADKSGRPARELTAEANMLLQAYPWPGNVRELENTIEQAVLLSDGDVITAGALPPHIAGQAAAMGDEEAGDVPFRKARERFEREYLETMLTRAGGNVAEAARRSGLNRQHFYAKMKSCGLPRGGPSSES